MTNRYKQLVNCVGVAWQDKTSQNHRTRIAAHHRRIRIAFHAPDNLSRYDVVPLRRTDAERMFREQRMTTELNQTIRQLIKQALQTP